MGILKTTFSFQRSLPFQVRVRGGRLKPFYRSRLTAASRCDREKLLDREATRRLFSTTNDWPVPEHQLLLTHKEVCCTFDRWTSYKNSQTDTASAELSAWLYDVEHVFAMLPNRSRQYVVHEDVLLLSAVQAEEESRSTIELAATYTVAVPTDDPLYVAETFMYPAEVGTNVKRNRPMPRSVALVRYTALEPHTRKCAAHASVP